MIRSALGKVAWVGRTASMVFGLALVMALVLGVAGMAFGANGQNFILGKLNNAATAMTGLVGNVNGSALKVSNPNPGADDTALTLNVQAGEAPMRVNSATRVANLNADRIDGKDFSAFSAQEVLDTIGALPREGTYTSKGGTLVITASGSGFRGTGTSQQAGIIGMNVFVDGSLVGRAEVYTNERNSHNAFVDEVAAIPVAAGQHTIRLEEIYATGTCNTANERPGDYCTDTDSNDRFVVTVVEIPD